MDKPAKRGEQVRAMFGDKDASTPVKRNPYVRVTKNGSFLDVNGMPVPKQGPGEPAPDAMYIPWLLFKYRP